MALEREWVVAALFAVAGGWLGSEAFGTLSTRGPVFDGLYILPALVAGVANVVLGVARRWQGLGRPLSWPGVGRSAMGVAYPGG